jgi:hypothetical protein
MSEMEPTVFHAKQKLKNFFQSLLWSGSETSDFGRCIAECVNHFWIYNSNYIASKNYNEITWTAIEMNDDEAFRILTASVSPCLDKARQYLNPLQGQAYPGQAQLGQYRQPFEELCGFISLVVTPLEARGDGRDDRVRRLLAELEELIHRWRAVSP